MIYTTYYARLKKIKELYDSQNKSFTIIQCSRTALYYSKMQELDNSYKEYFANYFESIKDFKKYLLDTLDNNLLTDCNRLRTNEIVDILYSKAKTTDLFLTCFEKDINKCHRKAIKDVFNKKFSKKYNMIIKEFEI